MLLKLSFGIGRSLFLRSTGRRFNLGAMAEIVEDGVTGLLFEAGNAADLRAKVDWMKSHPSERIHMGNNARRVFEEKYTPERNYEKLISIYQDD